MRASWGIALSPTFAALPASPQLLDRHAMSRTARGQPTAAKIRRFKSRPSSSPDPRETTHFSTWCKEIQSRRTGASTAHLYFVQTLQSYGNPTTNLSEEVYREKSLLSALCLSTESRSDCKDMAVACCKSGFIHF